MSKSCTDQRDSCKTSRFKGRTCSEQARFPLNEQVEGPNLLGTTKFPLNEQVRGPNLLGTSKTRHFVQEMGKSCTRQAKSDVFVQKKAKSCTEWECGLAKHCGTAAGLTPKPAATAGSAAWSFQGLHLRFRCCRTLRSTETSVLNTT